MAQLRARLGRPARLRAVVLWVLRHLVGFKGLRKLPGHRNAAVARPPPRGSRPVAALPADAIAPRQAAQTAQTADLASVAAKPTTQQTIAPSAAHAAAGTGLYGALLFLAGACPTLLPSAFLLFAATALPWRFYHYIHVQPRNRMYLLDFCYAVAAATTVFLCLPHITQRSHPRLAASVYALADGPVSAALVAWQCAWIWHSPEHTVSVLLHLLPGLAMAAHHHLPCSTASLGWGMLADPPAHASACIRTQASLSGTWDGILWLLGVPLAFYLAWQALYFLMVQVLGRRYVQTRNLDTSYRCLTRRARRANNIWARLVLRGSTGRRLIVYGLIQLAFTAGTLILFIPTYYFPAVAFAWQALKFLVPVYYGCCNQYERLYKAAMAEGVRRHVLQLKADARATMAPAAAG